MKVQETIGTCQLCGLELPPRKMTKHLAECVEDYRFDVGRDEERGDHGYHIAIHAKRAPMFWLHLLAASDAKLSQLDAFLRDVWMEGREKPSQFFIGDRIFSSTPARAEAPTDLERDMSLNLYEALENDIPFEYAYDREQTTELEARVVARRTVLPDQQTPIRLLARNDLPSIPCQCGGRAEHLCAACAEGPSGWLCPNCAGEHDCGAATEPTPIENTPRAIVQV